MKNLSVKWQKLIVWLTGYLNIIAFVIAGGYLFKNTENDEVRTSAKVALIATAVFTAIEIAYVFIQNCVCLAREAGSWLNTLGWVISLVKIVVFVILFIVDMTVGMGKPAKSDNNTAEAQENEQDA